MWSERQKNKAVDRNTGRSDRMRRRTAVRQTERFSKAALDPAVIKPHTHSIPQESNPTEAAAANPLKVSSEQRKTIRLRLQRAFLKDQPKIHFCHYFFTSWWLLLFCIMKDYSNYSHQAPKQTNSIINVVHTTNSQHQNISTCILGNRCKNHVKHHIINP